MQDQAGVVSLPGEMAAQDAVDLEHREPAGPVRNESNSGADDIQRDRGDPEPERSLGGKRDRHPVEPEDDPGLRVEGLEIRWRADLSHP
ncbi:hypothetical protein [Kitasatospora sp. NPDC093102]|uniref:hypothetical protein n=1 Tax=Kitasatospora sp. NPDC093102 TaxID=3155069 RepID=UPI00343E77F0